MAVAYLVHKTVQPLCRVCRVISTRLCVGVLGYPTVTDGTCVAASGVRVVLSARAVFAGNDTDHGLCVTES